MGSGDKNGASLSLRLIVVEEVGQGHTSPREELRARQKLWAAAALALRHSAVVPNVFDQSVLWGTKNTFAWPVGHPV